jgi:hypothetical protein
MAGDEEERARNEAAFRRANERLAVVVDGMAIDDRPAPFICECHDVKCHHIMFVRPSHYEQVRTNGRHFAVVTGHNGHGSQLVAEFDGYSVVEKQGRGGELAAELDPRRSEGP